MKAARIIAFSLIAAQAGLIGLFSSSYGLPLAAVVLSFLALAQPPVSDTRREVRVFLGLLVAALFLLSWRIGLFDRIRTSGFLESSFTYAMANLFLFLQALTLMTSRELPPLFLLWATAALANAGNIYADSVQTAVYEAVVIAFVAGWALALGFQVRSLPAPATGRAVRAAVLAVCLIGVAYLTSLSGQLVIQNRHRLDELFRAISLPYALPSAPGFSKSGEIGTISRLKFFRGANRVALRVFSDTPPGHLRGMAFEQYSRTGWQEARRERTPLFPEAPALRGASRTIFVLREAAADGWAQLQVWPAPEIEEGIFAPLDAAIGEFPVHMLERDSNGILDSGELVGGVDYTVFSPVTYQGQRAASVRWPPPFPAHLALPDHLDPRIVSLSRDIAGNARTAQEKIARVVDYLRSACTYRLFRRGRMFGTDTLSFFLFESREGHCEHFATAAAILLRVVGVPTRYVTGFLVSEQHPAGYWVARNRDAHAWVEAWDPDAGWVTVDPTPPEGIPQVTQMTGLAALLDRVKLSLQKFAATARVEGAAGIARMAGRAAVDLARFLMSDLPAAVACRVGFLLVLFLLLVRYHRRTLSAAAGDPHMKALRALLGTMDWRMRLRGLVRGPAETLREFAARISSEMEPSDEARSAASWYADYAACRYSGHLLAGHVEHLKKTMPRIQMRLASNGRRRRRGG